MTRFVPTLQAMADIYRMSTSGGADSERFRAYVELNRRAVPVSQYNPMTNQPGTIETVEHLLKIDAEMACEAAMNRIGLAGIDSEMAVVVLTPGAWTDRLFNEVRARRDGIASVWFWAGERPDVDEVAQRNEAVAVRAAWRYQHGPIETLLDYASVEGIAVRRRSAVTEASINRVLDVLEVLGSARDDETFIAYTFGDAVAIANGWAGLGLLDGEGIDASASVVPLGATAAELINARWSPI